MSEKETKFNPEAESNLTVNEYERFGGHVREIIGGPAKINAPAFRQEEENGYPQRYVSDIEYTAPNGNKISLATLVPRNWIVTTTEQGDVFIADIALRRIVYGQRHDTSVFSPASPKGYTSPFSPEITDVIKFEEKYKELIPEGHFVHQNEPIPAAESKGFFMRLLHEIGHAEIFDGMSQEEREEFARRGGQVLSKRPKDYSSKDRDEYENVIMNNERGAWQWALLKLEELRAQGIDLAPEFSTKEEMLAGIEGNLKNHAIYAEGSPPEKLINSLITAKYLDVK